MSDLADTGVVQEWGKSSKGTPKVKIGGEWYFQGRGLQTKPELGQTGSFTYKLFGDRNNLRSLESWNVHNSPPRANGEAPKAPAGYIDEASMRFISNVVGSAITAGAIKEPGQVLAWHNAAKLALQGKPAGEPFDDDVPY